jgi:hypothetical protein
MAENGAMINPISPTQVGELTMVLTITVLVGGLAYLTNKQKGIADGFTMDLYGFIVGVRLGKIENNKNCSGYSFTQHF